MKKHYYLIGWGLTLTVINVFTNLWIGRLIDAAAYIMIFAGLSKMRQVNSAFASGQKLVLVVLLMMIANIFIPYNLDSEASLEVLQTLPLWAWVISGVSILASYGLIYLICEGTRHEAEKEQEDELSRKMMTGWWTYLVSSLTVLAALILIISTEGAFWSIGLLIVGGLVFIVGIISIIVGLRRAGRDLYPEPHYETYK
ncbi:hypothetical protein [Saccharibacillus kuerlensis]|uniref:DUF3796 domain-containing protein n=1 Tax=Saccharibacillus kuerlensis TaxID=459527 RepID=A0ABQ2L2T5_9BACL|nr:hypothetical protein [Saccharibacillus kuerlensis]GGO00632.1 hypothetical protein GCM10010969_22050 [Saccharibacillus kuerlensis]